MSLGALARGVIEVSLRSLKSSFSSGRGPSQKNRFGVWRLRRIFCVRDLVHDRCWAGPSTTTATARSWMGNMHHMYVATKANHVNIF